MNNPFESVLQKSQQTLGNVAQGAKYFPSAINKVLGGQKPKKPVVPKTQSVKNSWSGVGKTIKDYAQNQQQQVNEINRLSQ